MQRLWQTVDETEATRIADRETLQYLVDRCHDLCVILDESSSLLRAKEKEINAKDACVAHLEIDLENARAENAWLQQRSTDLMENLEVVQRENIALGYERDRLKEDVR